MPRPTPPRVRVATMGARTRTPGPWTRVVPRSPFPPVFRSIIEHCMVAGPIFGVLSALYTAHLAHTAPTTPNLAAHAIIRQAQSWHGHFLRSYYITPTENTLSWLLAGPAVAWVILLVVVLVGLGIRSHYRAAETRDSRHKPR